MLDQHSDILLGSALLIAVPILVGIPVALRGSGRALWVAALAVVALALTLSGLRLATAIYGPGFDDIGPVFLGWLLSALGLALGLGACTVALIRAARERRWPWLVVLLLAAALPLLAALPIFDLDMLAIALAPPGEQVYEQLLDLAVLLPPIGCAVLVAFGAWSAFARHRPDVATAQPEPAG